MNLTLKKLFKILKYLKKKSLKNILKKITISNLKNFMNNFYKHKMSLYFCKTIIIFLWWIVKPKSVLLHFT